MIEVNHNEYIQNYRLYTFTHVYMSPIQHGIQSGHLAALMAANHEPAAVWAKHHFTMIVLNGGNSAMLKTTYAKLQEFGTKLNLNVGSFYEDEQSMEGMMTVVGILIPERIWGQDYAVVKERQRLCSTTLDKDLVSPLTPEEELFLFTSSFKLA